MAKPYKEVETDAYKVLFKAPGHLFRGLPGPGVDPTTS